jgi:hypothetical protein
VFERPGLRAGPLAFLAPVSKLQTAGFALLLGAAITFALHFAGLPEDLYRWAYHHVLSGLDVPDEPSTGTVDAVRYVSLVGGILELAGGVALLIADRVRTG